MESLQITDGEPPQTGSGKDHFGGKRERPSFLRVNLVVAIIACLSFAVFAIVISSRRKDGPAVRKASGSTKRMSASRRSGGEGAPDNADQQPQAQEPKLAPDVVAMVGPVSQDQNLNDLPYIPPTPQEEAEVRLTRHPPQPGQQAGKTGSAACRKGTFVASEHAWHDTDIRWHRLKP